MDRRSFIKYGAISSISLPLTKLAAVNINMEKTNICTHSTSSTICVFIKPLEKYSYEDIATMLSEAGFEGADISFRKGGLVTPETAGVELPKLVKAFNHKKLSIPMAVSGITGPDNPGTSETLEIMKDNGIGFYRLGSIDYDPQISIQENLSVLKVRIKKLEELNAKYDIHGAIQNHVGTGFAAPVWDAWEVIKDCDPQHLGFQYDVRHAVAEGIYSWPLALEVMRNHVYTTCIKDFTWEKEDGKFKPVTVSLGQGIVNFNKYFELINKRKHTGPVSIHYEYPLISPEYMNESISKQMERIIPVLRRDLEIYKKMQKQFE